MELIRRASVGWQLFIGVAVVAIAVQILKSPAVSAPWSQVYDPTGRWWLSTICAALPVIVLLGSLAFLHLKAHYAALLGLITSLICSVWIFHMPARMAVKTALYGACYGLLPIGWIILNVIFMYQLTCEAGLFKLLEQSLTGITQDRRLQVLLIAFSFGAFFEGAAGFGTPVAVTSALLIGLGFRPLEASGLSLIANTAPVAYGALGTPLVALQGVTGLDLRELSAQVGRILPFFSVLVPFWLTWAFAGFRGMLEIWPAVLIAGFFFAVSQFVISNFHGPWLVDVLAAIVSMAALILLLYLAQATRDEYPLSVSYILWLLCELAIIACDLAEVLGAAIGLNLLFHLPLLIGVLVTAADTLLVLWFTRLGIRVIEAFVLMLIATIAGCFAFEILLAKPNTGEVLIGLLPTLNSQTLYVAVAIFGATVMPHNLYLHSALVQTRQIGESEEEKRRACNYNFIDSTLALNGALFVNAAILVMSSAVFFRRHIVVTEIQEAHQLLSPLLGTTLASLLFGLALLCSGQSSTLTGTMAGQIVMEGFLRFRMQPWLRRAVTRAFAITPAALTIYFAGDQGTYKLIILSQVILSIQLPFAVIPLVHFTSDRSRMGRFANGPWLQLGAWSCAAFILVLNVWLLWTQVRDWSATSGSYRPFLLIGSSIVALAFLGLLVVITCWPWMRRAPVPAERIAVTVPEESAPVLSSPTYSSILVPLDHSDSDQEALGNALALARIHGAKILLLHVEEGVTSQLFGSLSSTAEIAEGQDYLANIVSSLRNQGVRVDVVVRHGTPATEIASAVQDLQPDLVVMASHGHRGLKDLIFGTTINAVRHRVKVPLLIVRGS